MARNTITLDIPTGVGSAGNGTAAELPRHIDGASHVHVGGIWGNTESMKVQYITDDRQEEADAWTNTAGGAIIGVAATWVKRTEDIPAEALAVRIVTAVDITPDATYPPIARWIYDEGSPA